MQRMMNENFLRYKHKLNYVIANQDMHLVINISIHRIKPDIFSFSLFFFLARIGRASLTEGEVGSWLKRTPNRRYGSTKLFRNLHEKGMQNQQVRRMNEPHG